MGGAGAIARGFKALAYPRCRRVVWLSALLALMLAVGLWYGLHWAIFEWQFLNWAWANWLIRQFGALALIVLMVLLFPALLGIAIGFFFDPVIAEVERRDYPHLPPARRQSAAEILAYVIRFTLVLLLANLVALPFYLLLPGANFLIAWAVNGYLFGREYFEAVAMRRLAPPEVAALRRERRGRLLGTGIAIAALKTVPVLNLVMPVVACAAFTHLFHGLPGRQGPPPRGARKAG